MGVLGRVKAHLGDAVLVLLSVALASPISGLLGVLLSADLAGAIGDLLAILIAGIVVFAAFEAFLSQPQLVIEWATSQRTASSVLTDARPAVPVGRSRKWEVRVHLRTSSFLAVRLVSRLRMRNSRLCVRLADIAGTLELTLESTTSDCITAGPRDRGFVVDLDRGLPEISWREGARLRTREIGRCKVSADALANAHGAESDVEMTIVRDKGSFFWNYAVKVDGNVQSIRADA